MGTFYGGSYRSDDIQRITQQMRIRPVDIMVTGSTGVGKSSTLNSLFGKPNMAKVGEGVDPETMELDSYSLSEVARFWDTPGLGDGVAMDRIHRDKLVSLLKKTYYVDDTYYGWIDMVLVLVDGGSRDLGTSRTLIRDVLLPYIEGSRILVAVNRCDMAMSGRHWLRSSGYPDRSLKDFLDKQAKEFQRRIREDTGIRLERPVYYSAEYGYNLDKVMDLIIDHLPGTRRPI